jgi:alanine dehydrogenase|tara:strand:- start:1015 stop:2241 length:1227 start_codon:yes stop_codon:yes gene_type:complete
MDTSKETLKSLSESALFQPKEQMMPVQTADSKMLIGIPKEIAFQEHRVAMTPNAVNVLVANGHEIIMESGAGMASNFSDNLYSEAGAQIYYSAKEVYQKASLILKVAPPTLEEIDLMQYQQMLVSALQLTVQPVNYMRKLGQKKIHGIAWDYIQDEDGVFPIVRAMGEIAGNSAIQIAAEYLAHGKKSRKALFGNITGVRPTEVVIFGAGAVGESAARAALGLGAMVRVFDKSLYKLRRIQENLGLRLNTSTPQPDRILHALKSADVAIGAIRSNKGKTPVIVSDEMVAQMKYSSVIIDVCIDGGGCFETSRVTTHDNPVFRIHDVIHYGVPNIASRVPRTASYALSNIFIPILLNFGEHGSFEEVLRRYQGVRNGVYMFNGIITNRYLGEALNLPYKDLDLLIAAMS